MATERVLGHRKLTLRGFLTERVSDEEFTARVGDLRELTEVLGEEGTDVEQLIADAEKTRLIRLGLL